MLEQIASAIAARDYENAELLLKQLQEQNRENPWIDYYQGCLLEAKGDNNAATAQYRQLLQNTDVPKIISSARQGIDRIAKIAREKKQAALELALAQPENQLMGVLILEPIPAAAKQAAAQQFARIMNLDPYTARMQLPSRAWRLYRIGKIGELKLQVESLQQVEIPCFCQVIEGINRIKVYQVEYFESLEPKVTIIARDREKKVKKIDFNWQEIGQRVDGLLPLFEASLHTDPNGKHYRKTETLDYVRVCDLHLKAKNTILRLCDFNYQFKQGINFLSTSVGQSTNRENWNHLDSFLKEKLPQIKIRDDFSRFAETAIEKADLLLGVKPRINLLRREESPWDNAFEIYSSLILLKNTFKEN